MGSGSRRAVVPEVGGPDVLTMVDEEPGEPGPDEIVVDVAAAGLNFIDVYHRTGAYPQPLPFVPGMEGAGVVRQVGTEVRDLSVGDRVAWPYVLGSYAERVVIPAAQVAPVPDDVSLVDAGGLILQATTAQFLASSVYDVTAGDVVGVHAAAGGVGLLLLQVCKARGAVVVATASTDEKQALVSQAGADVVTGYDGFEDAVRTVSDGRGAAVVYDGVGRSTFDASLASLRTRGLLALYGMASGPVPPFDLQRLGVGGSLIVTRPRFPDFIADPAELRSRAAEVFDGLRSGRFAVRPLTTYRLDEAAAAHRDLEGRAITGKAVLVP